MKKIYFYHYLLSSKDKTKKFLYLLLWSVLVIPSAFFAQQTYTFTNAGNTGSVGPSQTQLNTAYLSTNLNGSVTMMGNGVQSWTVPTTGGYGIRAIGASGGTTTAGCTTGGGLGANMYGEYTLTAGTVLRILVGQMGSPSTASQDGGGGGGTYVATSGSVAMVVAGGGGGSTSNLGGCSGSQRVGLNATTNGTATSGANGLGVGGINGGGGTGTGGGAGAGFSTNGTGGSNVSQSFMNGGLGGNYNSAGPGGFGGGGSGYWEGGNGGGGGGYSGGGTNSGSPYSGGGGGGSYNSGTSQVNAVATATGHGRVIISELCNIKIIASGSNSLNPSICSGNSLTLTTTAVSNYTWSNGNSSTTSIVVTPTANTTYSIVGTSSLSCQAQAFITVLVGTGLPVLSIANPSNNICLGRTVSLTATGAVTYTWTNPGVVNGQTFTPTSTQIYTVQGQNGCGITTTVTTITVASLPVSTLATPTIVCMGYPSTLTAVSSVGGYTWQPVALYGSSVIVSPTANIIYTVTASDGTCSGTQTLALTTKITPTITASTSNSSICQGQSVVLTANGGSTYNWMPGNLAGNTITVSPAISTLYSVDGTNGVGCTASANQVVLVTGSPTLNIVANKTTVCAGNPVNLFASGATTYTWTNGPSTSAYTVNPTSSTVYTVSGNQGSNVCVGSNTIAITAIISNVTVSSNTAVCTGGTATLTASGASTYTWNGIPMAGNGNFPVSPTGTTIYTCVANTTSGSVNCPTTKTVQVAIFPNPTITVVATKSLICKAQSNTLTATGAVSYSWGAAGTGSSIVVKPNTTTIYQVTAIDANGCQGTQLISVLVNACLGISELNSGNQNVLIYPNPSAGELTITSDSDISLKISNELGQEVKHIELTAQNGYKVSLSDLASGIYIISGQNENGQVNQKVIITK